MRAFIISLLNRFPGLKRVLRQTRDHLCPEVSISSNYVNLQGKEADAEGRRLLNSWRDNSLPERQREFVDQQLLQYRSGARIDVFDIFVESISSLPNLGLAVTLLEVGCSSGFYSEVIKISGLPIKYSGCDYSDAFIKLAKERHPSIDFAVEDATAMDYADSSFDIVVSGCCLLHIPEYKKAIEETARVARRFAIFHRTPVVWGQPEQWYRKNAYGVETVEIHFNELEFLQLLAKCGLELIATYTLSDERTDSYRLLGHANRTYVCRKKNQ
jgi:SAM-dependent methyltransferase